jgi:nicotinamide-nucleotide amidase
MSHDIAITDLSARVVEAARASTAKLITVESCTAGALCTLLADTPGAGDVLLGGFVTYAKACKSEVLGISSEVLETYSAVSAEVVAAMAEGALSKCTSATIAVAVTCVGGPKPDDDGNPVGLTYLAVKRRGGPVNIHQLQIDEQSSGRIRGEVLSRALRMLLEVLAAES